MRYGNGRACWEPGPRLVRRSRSRPIRRTAPACRRFHVVPKEALVSSLLHRSFETAARPSRRARCALLRVRARPPLGEVMARRRINHHPHPEEHRAAMRLEGWPDGGYFLAAANSVAGPSQPMTKSAIWPLFLSIISMWLLPLMPAAGRSTDLAG